MQLTYPAIIYGCGDEDGYAILVPDLPGCVSGGDTLAEAVTMGIDAASGWVLGELRKGKKPPKASPMGDISPDPSEEHSLITMLALDINAYSEENNPKNVRKSLTIPAWLNTYAEKNHISYSKVLRESLTEMYVRENQAAYG